MKKGYLYGVLSAVLFGSAGLFVKLAQTEIDSVSLLTLQYIVAVTLMFLILLIKDRKAIKISKRNLMDLVILGVLGNTFMTVFYYLTFKYLPVAMTTILLMTYPILVFIYSIIIEHKKIEAKKLFAVILAFTGCIFTLDILKGDITYSVTGIGFGFLAALFYAFMNIFSEKRLEEVSALTINAYSTLFSLISLIIFKVPTFLFQGGVSTRTLTNIVILAIFCEIIPLTLLYAAIKKIGAVKVSIISNLEIPTSLIISVIILKESFSVIQFFGALTVVYAVYLIKR